MALESVKKKPTRNSAHAYSYDDGSALCGRSAQHWKKVRKNARAQEISFAPLPSHAIWREDALPGTAQSSLPHVRSMVLRETNTNCELTRREK